MIPAIITIVALTLSCRISASTVSGKIKFKDLITIPSLSKKLIDCQNYFYLNLLFHVLYLKQVRVKI
jgi:hypothetical protein